MIVTVPARMWYFGRTIKWYCYGMKIVLNVHDLCYYIKALNYKLDFILQKCYVLL